MMLHFTYILVFTTFEFHYPCFESNDFHFFLDEEINDCHYLNSLQVPGNLIPSLMAWMFLRW